MNNENAAISTVAGGRGANWLAEGFALFRQAPGPWIGACVLWIVVTLALHQLPLIGALAANLLLPVVVGGLMLGTRSQSEGRGFTLDYLWSGFNAPQFNSLLLLGVFSLLAALAVGVVIAGAVGASMLGALVSGDTESIHMGFAAVIPALVLLLLLVPLSMALWFAPALVALNGMEPVAALKASLRGCLANVAPFLVYGLLTLLIAIAATIPFGLGWLVALPVMVASTYFGYRDIFPGSPIPAASTPAA